MSDSLYLFFVASTLDRRIQIKWRYRPQRPIRILHDKIDNFSTKKPVIWYCSVSKCLSLGHLFGVRVCVRIVMYGWTEHICATQQCIPFIYFRSFRWYIVESNGFPNQRSLCICFRTFTDCFIVLFSPTTNRSRLGVFRFTLCVVAPSPYIS